MPVDVRKATLDDIPAIVAMLADDELGARRETPGDLGPYERAFGGIAADPNQALVVADDGGTIVGTLQLTVIPGLARTAASRGHIEAVRVASAGRSAGVGGTLMRWAIDEARARGCRLVQLTSDATRTRAHEFYERLGFVPSHVGFKLEL
jgi:ribosomal protein S18 acetylase RimI-like enzyme